MRLTSDRIEAIRIIAGEHGDDRTVEDCRAALAGDARAKDRVRETAEADGWTDETLDAWYGGRL